MVRPAVVPARTSHRTLENHRHEPWANRCLRTFVENRCGEPYFNKTRVPRIFWALIAFRNVGNRRSINSKNDERAGVCVFWL